MHDLRYGYLGGFQILCLLVERIALGLLFADNFLPKGILFSLSTEAANVEILVKEISALKYFYFIELWFYATIVVALLDNFCDSLLRVSWVEWKVKGRIAAMELGIVKLLMG